MRRLAYAVAYMMGECEGLVEIVVPSANQRPVKCNGRLGLVAPRLERSERPVHVGRLWQPFASKRHRIGIQGIIEPNSVAQIDWKHVAESHVLCTTRHDGRDVDARLGQSKLVALARPLGHQVAHTALLNRLVHQRFAARHQIDVGH